MLINFGPNRFGAMGAQVFIFVTFWQNKKKPLANRNGLFTFLAVKLRCVKLFINIGSVLWAGEYTRWIRSTLHLNFPMLTPLPIQAAGFQVYNGE
jgi:hypothetical protein